MLKGVQDDILVRTRRLAEDMASAPTEAQLREAEQLGKNQAQLKQLTLELTEKSRQGP